MRENTEGNHSLIPPHFHVIPDCVTTCEPAAPQPSFSILHSLFSVLFALSYICTPRPHPCSPSPLLALTLARPHPCSPSPLLALTLARPHPCSPSPLSIPTVIACPCPHRLSSPSPLPSPPPYHVNTLTFNTNTLASTLLPVPTCAFSSTQERGLSPSPSLSCYLGNIPKLSTQAPFCITVPCTWI